MKYKLTGIALVLLGISGAASANTVTPCQSLNCAVSFSISVDGNTPADQLFIYDAQTGQYDYDHNRVIAGTYQNSILTLQIQDQSLVYLKFPQSGNDDPIFKFAVAATTTTNSHQYSFAFDMPINISGPIEATSKASYWLTSLSPVGGQIAPAFNATVIHARDVDTSPNGLSELDKGIDAGGSFSFVNPHASHTANFFDTSLITGSYDYDIMSTLINFSLTPLSTVIVSGIISQTEVPLPASLPLFGLAVGILGLSRRRGRVQSPKMA